MKSKYLVIKILILSVILTGSAFSAQGQSVEFYSNCLTDKQEGDYICLPILVKGLTNIDALQLGLNINELVFKVDSIMVPAKNPLDIDGSSFSNIFGEISLISSNISDASFADGDTLVVFCGRLIGQPGDIISVVANTSFNSILKRDPVDPSNSIQLDQNEISYNFCEMTVDPVGNALTIVAGHCDRILGGDPNSAKLFLKFFGGTGPYNYTIIGDGGFSALGSGVVFDTVLMNLPQENLTITVFDANMNSATMVENISVVNKLSILLDSIENPKCNILSGGNNQSGSITVRIEGGEEAYNLYWSTNEKADIINVGALKYYKIDKKPEGVYTLKVIDRQGCEVSDTFHLIAPPVLRASVDNALIPCATSDQGEIVVNVEGGVPYGTGNPYKYYMAGRLRDLIANTIPKTNLNSDIRIYDSKNCFTELAIRNPDGTTKFNIDSVFLDKDSMAFTCFETVGLLQVETSVISTYNFATPRINDIVKIGDPGYQFDTIDIGRNRINQFMAEGSYQVITQDLNGGCPDTFLLSVIRPEQLTVDTVVKRPDCLDTIGEILILAQGGTAPYSYTWSQDLNKKDSLWSNIKNGNFNISVTDANNCNVTNFNIIIDSSQILMIDSIKVLDTILCGNPGSVQVYTSYPNASFTWSNGTTGTPFISTTTPGLYSVAVSDNGLCQQLASINLPIVSNFKVFSHKFDPICGANDGSNTGAIEVDTILGGNPQFTYVWSLSGTNDIVSTTKAASGLREGSYDLRILDASNCAFDTTFVLTAPPALGIMVDTSSIRGVTCNQGTPDGRALVIASGGLGSVYRYEWSNFERGPLAIRLPMGVNTVFAFDSTNCVSDTISIIIPESPQPIIRSTFTIPSCPEAKDGTISLEIQGRDSADMVNILWNIDGVAQSGPIANNVGVGSYQYLVNINGNLNCPIFDTVTISDSRQFSVAIDPLTTSDNSCKALGTSGMIGLVIKDGEGPVNYTFNGDSITGSIGMDLASGTYNIIARNAAGCADTLEHILDFDMQVRADLSSFTDPKCVGEKICINPENVTGGNGRGYRFGIDFGPPQDITECMELLPGEYFMQVYDSDGCRFDTTFTIGVPDKFEIDLGEDITFDIGDDMPEITVDVVSGGLVASVNWTDANNIDCMDAACTNVRIAQIAAFTLRAEATSVDGCLASDEITIRINEKENVFIPNAFRPGSSLNADDRNDTWTVAIGKGVDKVLGMRIFDRWGNKMFEAYNDGGLDESTSWDGTFRGTQLDPGVFVYELDVEFIKRADEAAPRRKVFTGSITLLR